MPMSTIANALKLEIARVARKELKDEFTALRKMTTNHRSEIAALKREIKALVSVVKRLQKTAAAPASPRRAVQTDDKPKRRGRQSEFSAEKLADHRTKLGLTQVQMAQLIGASALSVYKWESGKVQPRAAQKEQIAAALKIGKRAAQAMLQNPPT